MLVLPSCQNSEAFGLVILEAQAFARPVISTNLPTGISFINRHQETGLVVPPADVSALREGFRPCLAPESCALNTAETAAGDWKRSLPAG